jgi:hypothetical protein
MAGAAMVSVSLRTNFLISAGLFGAILVLAIIGNVLEKAGVGPLTGGRRLAVMVVFFGLFLAFGFSLVPVMVKTVLGAQVSLGNQDVAVVAAALRRQHLIIWVLWALMGAGTIVAVPAAIAGGMFNDSTVPSASSPVDAGTGSPKP